jgi:hypothetical protein
LNIPNNSNLNIPSTSAGALNTTTGLLAGTRFAGMTLKTEHFEKRYIDRDSILLDSTCFNYIFNSKKWFIDYKDIKTISTGASNGGTGAVVGRGTVRISLLLPSGQTHFLEMPNTLY